MRAWRVDLRTRQARDRVGRVERVAVTQTLTVCQRELAWLSPRAPSLLFSAVCGAVTFYLCTSCTPHESVTAVSAASVALRSPAPSAFPQPFLLFCAYTVKHFCRFQALLLEGLILLRCVRLRMRQVDISEVEVCPHASRTGVRSLVREDRACLRGTQPLCHRAELALHSERRPHSEKPHSPRPEERPPSSRGPAPPNESKL
ncbi:unnamed protein product [Rangifer tarandus platyrhynchus]|uniref:Uncharacterized protein n=1 Tax=Rangifer tarandus platyrhynchus TaxID=3082113 RepID=A0AC59Z1B3_RANTA